MMTTCLLGLIFLDVRAIMEKAITSRAREGLVDFEITSPNDGIFQQCKMLHPLHSGEVHPSYH